MQFISANWENKEKFDGFDEVLGIPHLMKHLVSLLKMILHVRVTGSNLVVRHLEALDQDVERIIL